MIGILVRYTVLGDFLYYTMFGEKITRFHINKKGEVFDSEELPLRSSNLDELYESLKYIVGNIYKIYSIEEIHKYIMILELTE